MSVSDFHATNFLLQVIQDELPRVIIRGDMSPGDASSVLLQAVSRLTKSNPNVPSTVISNLANYSREFLAFVTTHSRAERLVNADFLNATGTIEDPFVRSVIADKADGYRRLLDYYRLIQVLSITPRPMSMRMLTNAALTGIGTPVTTGQPVLISPYDYLYAHSKMIAARVILSSTPVANIRFSYIVDKDSIWLVWKGLHISNQGQLTITLELNIHVMTCNSGRFSICGAVLSFATTSLPWYPTGMSLDNGLN